MAWTILVVAGLLEICWAVGLKLSDGLTKPFPAVLTVMAMIASMVLLGIAVRSLPLGTAYAVWTGIGAVGSVLLGIVLFHEPATAGRLLCVAAIVGGIIGLKLLAPPDAEVAKQQVER
jgi:quaternary ammonium compound-resistance protein SugE